MTQVAAARTFTIYEDIEELIKLGKIKGGSLDCAVVIKGDKIISKEPLRFKDEFVRHKVLDLIGDLALLGRPIHGHVIARNGGHALNFQLVVAIEHALRLAHRPAEAPVRVVSAERAESFAPAPGLAATL